MTAWVPSAADLLLATAAAAGAVVALWGIVRKVVPPIRSTIRRIGGTLDTLGGRDPVIDRATGKVLVPGTQGLAHRLDGLEEHGARTNESLEKLTELVAGQHAQDARLDSHEERLRVLEEHQIERTAARVESAAMWTAVCQANDLLPPDLAPDPNDPPND